MNLRWAPNPIYGTLELGRLCSNPGSDTEKVGNYGNITWSLTHINWTVISWPLKRPLKRSLFIIWIVFLTWSISFTSEICFDLVSSYPHSQLFYDSVTSSTSPRQTLFSSSSASGVSEQDVMVHKNTTVKIQEFWNLVIKQLATWNQPQWEYLYQRNL